MPRPYIRVLKNQHGKLHVQRGLLCYTTKKNYLCSFFLPSHKIQILYIKYSFNCLGVWHNELLVPIYDVLQLLPTGHFKKNTWESTPDLLNHQTNGSNRQEKKQDETSKETSAHSRF